MADLREPRPAAELAEVDIRLIRRLGLALTAIVVGCALALLGLRAWLVRDAPRPIGPTVDTSALARFAKPQLEPAPADSLAALEHDKKVKLHRYRWIDRSRGIVQIPIERAMEIMVRAETEGVDGAQRK